MSVKFPGKIWEMNLSFSQKLVLPALADHADHDGNNAYPGLDILAAKTRYSLRNVRRILTSLEDRGVTNKQAEPDIGLVSMNESIKSRQVY
jgi:hypothetical protein